MKTSKRTPTAKGRRKAAKGRREVTGRSIFPFGNDIFDVIDYHFTYKRGWDDSLEWVQETFGPTARKLLREVDDIRQEKAKLESELKEALKKKSHEAAGEVARLQRELEVAKEKEDEILKEVEKLKKSLEKSAASNKWLIEKLYDTKWTFRDRAGKVLADGNTKEELAKNIFTGIKRVDTTSEVLFKALKEVVEEVGPVNPAPNSFAGTVMYSNTREELRKKWASIPEEELIKKFINFTAKRDSRRFITRPTK